MPRNSNVGAAQREQTDGTPRVVANTVLAASLHSEVCSWDQVKRMGPSISRVSDSPCLWTPAIQKGLRMRTAGGTEEDRDGSRGVSFLRC